MSFEELDKYIEVMPADVAEEYKAFRGLDLEEDWVTKVQKDGHSTTINVYGNITDSQIQVGTVASSQIVDNTDSFPYDEILKMMAEIDKYKEMLIQDLGENGEQFAKVLNEISEEVRSQGNPTKIKKTLGILREFVVGVSGSLAASGVLALIQQIRI